jgi:hypothetical protein
MARAFPYLGHGVAARDALRVWVVLDDAAGQRELAPEVKAWGKRFGIGVAHRKDGAVVSIEVKGARRVPPKLWVAAQEKLDEAVAESSPALVVRESKRFKASAWHTETLADPARVLDVLARVVNRKSRPYAREDAPRGDAVGGDMRDVLLATIRGNPRAELAHAALEMLIRGTKGRAARAVLDDVLEERLTAMFGMDFDLDIVVREALALARGLSSTSIQMPKAFYVAVEGRMTAAKVVTRAPKGKVDWRHIESVREALGRSGSSVFAFFSFDDASPEHRKTLLALTHEERLAFAKKGPMLALKLANSAAHVLAQRDYETALTLYDAALEGELPPGALANPLFAVQDDNNHLGVDQARSRRYLERCLRNAPEENPTIFLNAAFVLMELGELDEAMRMLALAKKHGVRVKLHRNERLFIPLRTRSDFAKVMR